MGNYARYSGGKADDLLNKYTSTAELSQQKEIATQLQKVFGGEVAAKSNIHRQR